MSRIFNGKEVELLAPAGTFEIFKQIISSGADAVYLGGKKFNMRMHRKDYNLSDEEIDEAVSIAHSLGKKVYITFNNMLSDTEIDEAKNFLLFLQKVQPDALIIQNMGVLAVIKELELDIPLHASVMMNVHNQAMIDKLQDLGISRVVMSREISLETIHRFSQSTSMEFEYFVHGDMCVAHGAQCLYSGVLFGKSSNRGLCMKPCRWPFRVKGQGFETKKFEYHLAVKDMCMYRHIPALINAGVNSFKVEGRMRDSQYLISILNIYRKAIDRYLDDPTGYYVDEEDFRILYDTRVRNLSTCYAFKIPGKSNIDLSGEREPRIFSNAVEEFEIHADRIQQIRDSVPQGKGVRPLLTVKVNNMEALKQAVDNGADEIYMAGEVFRTDRPFTKEQFKEAVWYGKDKKVYLSLPRMMFDRQFADYKNLLEEWQGLGIKGIVITNLGAAAAFQDSNMDLIGDYSLNCYNSKDVQLYHQEGLCRITISVEAPWQVLKETLKRCKAPVEMIVQGAPVVMYMEHCVYASQYDVEDITDDAGFTAQDCCQDFCKNGILHLIDEQGCEHPVFSDQYCRNHIVTSKDVCLLPLLKELCALGVKAVRIEGQHYQPDVLGKVVSIYRNAIDSIHEGKETDGDLIKQLKQITGRGQSSGALNYD
ncbi:MAG: family peptidase [Clostridiales bacterium]|jgi:putative protease|nr:family peptidase [Clostridiales bacterium]MDK2932884.1 family peptidase [Clostridiales bacterium]